MAIPQPPTKDQQNAALLAEALNYVGLFACPKGRSVLAKQCQPKQREDLLRRAVAQLAQAIGALEGRFKFGRAADEAKRLGAAAKSGDAASLEKDAALWVCDVARAVGLPVPALGTREAMQCPVHGTKCPKDIPGLK